MHQYAYTAYGTVDAVQEEAFNPFRYVGQYGVMYEGNGLYYMRARYYQPELRRFLGEDPIWNKNLFAYVENNPLVGIDPSGLVPEWMTRWVPDWATMGWSNFFRYREEEKAFEAAQRRYKKASALYDQAISNHMCSEDTRKYNSEVDKALLQMSHHADMMNNRINMAYNDAKFVQDVSTNTAAGIALFTPAAPTALLMGGSGAAGSIIEEGYGNNNWSRASTGVAYNIATAGVGYKLGIAKEAGRIDANGALAGNLITGFSAGTVKVGVDGILDYPDNRVTQDGFNLFLPGTGWQE